MREAWLIARREYLERIRSKAFRISTVLIPLFFALIFGVGALSGKFIRGPRHIVVASNDPLLAESERAELMAAETGASGARKDPSSRLTVEVKAPLTESELAPLNAQVESKQIDGYLWLNRRPGTTRLEATYTSGGSADFVGKDRMQDAIGHALVREELEKRGATSEEIQELLKDVDLKTQQVKNATAA